MSSEERLRQASQLSRAGLSYAQLLRRGGADRLAPRPALTRRLTGLLRQKENVLLVGRPGSGRRSLVQLARQRCSCSTRSRVASAWSVLALPIASL